MPKNFHDVRNSKKMLSYGSRKGMGPFRSRPKRCAPTWTDAGHKNAAQGATNTQDGKADPESNKINESGVIVPAREGDCQA